MCSGDEIKEVEMGWACGIYGVEKRIEDICEVA
jgi:hypothetical protein